MSPTHRVLPHAFVLSWLAVAACAAPASAQLYDATVRSLDLTSDVTRSPRLLGMGSLSLVIPDRNNDLNLWDFAHNVAGIYGDDSTSTLELRPGTNSASGAHDAPSGLRQDLAGRGQRLGFEAYHRDTSGSVFGAFGDLNSIRADQPYGDLELRQRSVGQPDVTPILSGALPYFGAGKLRYVVKVHFGEEHQVDRYRAIASNFAGQFLSLDTATLNPPNFFDPNNYTISQNSLGGALSYPVGKHQTLALAYDAVREKVTGSNTGDRYATTIDESRPYEVGQASFVGRVGRHFEYGIDGRGWTSSSEQDWRFTISAGVGAFPLDGRGKLLTRKEEGSELNSRVRWTFGKLELGGQLWTQASKINVDPPALTDLSSFNTFIDQLWYRVGADTLTRPDSVVSNESREYAWGYGAGASYKLHRGIIGAEWHWNRDLDQSELNGLGPKRIGWDIRSGLEYQCNAIVTGRLGYAHRWVDLDDFTQQNEYVGDSGSLGLGLHPVGSLWTFELGYALEWLRSDFGDPTAQHSSRQDLSMQVHWTF